MIILCYIDRGWSGPNIINYTLGGDEIKYIFHGQEAYIHASDTWSSKGNKNYVDRFMKLYCSHAVIHVYFGQVKYMKF